MCVLRRRQWLLPSRIAGRPSDETLLCALRLTMARSNNGGRGGSGNAEEQWDHCVPELGVLPEQALLVFGSNTSCVMKVNVWKVSDLQPVAPTFGSHFSLCTCRDRAPGILHVQYIHQLHFRKKRKVRAKETQKRARTGARRGHGASWVCSHKQEAHQNLIFLAAANK